MARSVELLDHLTSDEYRLQVSTLPMDTELARPFLIVVASGSFVAAAERLHVAQSTVSMRIQRLEQALGAEPAVAVRDESFATVAGPHRLRDLSITGIGARANFISLFSI